MDGLRKSTRKKVKIMSMRDYIYGQVAEQVSSFTRYYDSLTQLDKLSWDDQVLFKNIKCRKKTQLKLEDLPKFEEGERDAVLLNGNLNYSYNIQEMLTNIYEKNSRSSRVICIVYNYYLSFLYSWATKLGLRKGKVPDAFITQVDLENFSHLAGYEICYQSNMIQCPFKLLGLGTLINKVVGKVPFLNNLSLVTMIVLRPVKEAKKKSISILIPARNERGNIRAALDRIPDMGVPTEVIFVEGNSSDNTWEEIKKVSHEEQYTSKYKIKYLQQPGKGKYDAVKVGFDAAENDILMILDADLTMPPELLPQFFNAYVEGKGDFINGSRLVYPMESEAMRFLNLLGNKFFTKMLSFLLDFKLSDTLCGTKVLSKKDYDRVVNWRKDFGDFDPFGDFELLFSASELKMGIINIPVRYRDREYGCPQIDRFRDGLILLKMTILAFFKIKLKRL